MIPTEGQTDLSKETAFKDLALRPDSSDGLCARLNDKWTVMVLWHIACAEERRIRFSALKQAVDGITQRMLTLTLRNLERDGLILRDVFPEVPPRVEYELTQMGAGMLEALKPINSWIVGSMPHIVQCRLEFDQKLKTQRPR